MMEMKILKALKFKLNFSTVLDFIEHIFTTCYSHINCFLDSARHIARLALYSSDLSCFSCEDVAIGIIDRVILEYQVPNEYIGQKISTNSLRSSMIANHLELSARISPNFS